MRIAMTLLTLATALVACDDGGDGRPVQSGGDATTGAGGVPGMGGAPGAGGTPGGGGVPGQGGVPGAGGQPPACEDVDRDGYQSATCNPSPAAGGGDCDDFNNTVFPGAAENCALDRDSDCNGQPAAQDPACQAPCADADGDGYQSAACNADRTTGGDCADDDRTVNPGMAEVCGNDKDDDCRGGDTQCVADCVDADQDGFGDGSGCLGPDCDDRTAVVNPWQSEVCGDAVDQDCDGADLECPEDCEDADRDGFGRGDGCIAADCNDGDPSINPAAREIPGDGLDQDCDGNDLVLREGCEDRDQDGYGPSAACIAGDCDDTNPRVHRDRAEICGNGVDDDCMGGDRPCVRREEGLCVDSDGDGFGPGDCPRGSLDCDNLDPLINPDAAETCNGKDDNCNGQVDECPLQNQVCETGRCVGQAGAPCDDDRDCALEANLRCNPRSRQCRVTEGQACDVSADCEAGAECLVLLDCDAEQRRCYQGKGGVCDADCDCGPDLLCHADNQRCVECNDDADCAGEGPRDTCTGGGYCAETRTIGGAGRDARYDFYRQLVACWDAFLDSPEVHACDILLVDRTLEVEGAPSGGFGPLEVEYQNDSPCDDAALATAGFSEDDIAVLNEIFGGCSDFNLNRVNVWWTDRVVPGGIWCLFYAPDKAGFGFPVDRRQALVVERCDVSIVE